MIPTGLDFMVDNPCPECPTVLLDDSPAARDVFASGSDLGPHERVATAIGEMIESSEDGGKAIGLEGGWGAGKSTVINLLSERFDANNDFTVVLFDAWAHEGDPLRRTFLETLVDELCKYGWAEPKRWQGTLDELAHRKKTTKTRSTSKPTLLGVAMAFSLLAVPLGSAMLGGGFRTGDTSSWQVPPSFFFVAGAICLLSPFAVLLFNALRLGVMWCNRKWRAYQGHKASSTVKTSIAENWALLDTKSVNETETESTETPNPTSLEFDRQFSALMSECLGKKVNRRLLVVLDNLDRVDADTALGIWGTMQTFLHDRNHEKEAWFKQLWVVIPYDPVRIRRLWPETGKPSEQIQSNNDEAAQGTNQTTESFLDKSFQVRFLVAPPVLSNWKEYLHGLFLKALPQHEDDSHIIYRVFDQCRARSDVPPTPRELKLYVNQIGAIHRQWQHTFPLSHVAYFVLTRKKHHNLISMLREGTIPSSSDTSLLGNELSSNLAGLAFNVERKLGMELLLADSIDEALKSGDADDLAALHAMHETGFWPVTEAVASTRWDGFEAEAVGNIAHAFQGSSLLSSFDGPERTTIIRSLKSATLAVESWVNMTEVAANGIASLLELVDDPEYTEQLLAKVSTHLRTLDTVVYGVPVAKINISGVVSLLNAATSLGHTDAIPKSITLPYQGEKWTDACVALRTFDASGRYWKLFRPRGDFSEVSSAITAAIEGDDFGEEECTTLHLSQKSAAKCNWKKVVDAIQLKLDPAQGATTQSAEYLLRGILELYSLGVDQAESLLGSTSFSSLLLHYYHQAESEGSQSAQCCVLFCYVSQHPAFAKPAAVGNSEAGYQLALQQSAEPDAELISGVVSLAGRYSLLRSLLATLMELKELLPIHKALLRAIADTDNPEEVYSVEEVMGSWGTLRPILNGDKNVFRFQKLVGQIHTKHNICDFLMQKEEGFEPDCTLLYLDVLRAIHGVTPEFAKWCSEGLGRMSKDEWARSLDKENASCALAVELCEKNSPPMLSVAFEDALSDHAKEVVVGNQIPLDWICKRWPNLVNCIDVGTRKVLRERLVETAVAADGTINDAFFVLYGDEISDSQTLAANQRVVSHLFSAVVREKHLRGLEWLNSFLGAQPDFMNSVDAEHTVQEFMSRVQESVNGQVQDEEADGLIASIGSKLGIEPSGTTESEVDSVPEDTAEPSASED